MLLVRLSQNFRKEIWPPLSSFLSLLHLNFWRFFWKFRVRENLENIRIFLWKNFHVPRSAHKRWKIGNFSLFSSQDNAISVHSRKAEGVKALYVEFLQIRTNIQDHFWPNFSQVYVFTINPKTSFVKKEINSGTYWTCFFIKLKGFPAKSGFLSTYLEIPTSSFRAKWFSHWKHIRVCWKEPNLRREGVFSSVEKNEKIRNRISLGKHATLKKKTVLSIFYPSLLPKLFNVALL